MSALAKIKKQAAQLEHDRQYDKALVLYARLLDEADGAADGDEVDVALYNRAGDVALRAGDATRAVGYYERALDRYASGGFLNNAIALGAKILRQAPERVATHYTLGVLYAKKGFRSDARQHFLSYAERMHRGGQGAEVARSLADYVVLCDGAADARAGLAAHLATGAARPAELAQKLTELLEQALQAAGQLEDGAGARRAAGAADLVFLDLEGAARDAAPDVAPDAPPAGAEEPLELLGDVFAAAPEAYVELPAELPVDEAVPVAARLAALPGELPPLAPSQVALDAGDAATDGLVLLDAADDEAPLDLEAPSGVPAFADFEEPAFEPAAFEVPAFEPPAFDAPTFEAPTFEAPAFADLDPEPAAFEPPLPEPVAIETLAPEPVAIDVLADLPLLDEAEPADELDPVVVEVAPPALAAAAPAPVARPDDDGIDLGAWLRESEPAPSTRLVAPAMPTTGDEEADFQATLQAFKAGIARSLADADFDAHYDLGVAYKEMGLLEEAIGEFQKAARAPERPLRALEALAECFLERGEPQLVLSTLAGAAPRLADGSPGAGEASQHVALCYLLGAASQEVGRTEDARAWYLRVLATDYAFRDAATRLASLSPPAR